MANNNSQAHQTWVQQHKILSAVIGIIMLIIAVSVMNGNGAEPSRTNGTSPSATKPAKMGKVQR